MQIIRPMRVLARCVGKVEVLVFYTAIIFPASDFS